MVHLLHRLYGVDAPAFGGLQPPQAQLWLRPCQELGHNSRIRGAITNPLMTCMVRVPLNKRKTSYRP